MTGMLIRVSNSEEKAGQRLSQTALRDFGLPVPPEERGYGRSWHRFNISLFDFPVPVLLRYALTLIGMPSDGPGEKVAWWVEFAYKGYPCELAHQKFGLRLYIGGELTDERASDLQNEIYRKLRAAIPTVEALLTETAGDILNSGEVTVVNQHRQLRRAYDYFRERATHPAKVEDLTTTGSTESGNHWNSFVLGQNVMALNASHDLVAAISAFLSSLEHDLVLTLPFSSFNPATDNLSKIIGDRWGLKWRRVIGHTDPEAARLRQQLTEVVERWRNPYSHGGFEKGHGATIYLHTPTLGALPVGRSGIRDSPLFSFNSVTETTIQQVFALFDDIDTYREVAFPHATQWINTGLDVRFDTEFMTQVVDCIDTYGDVEKLIRGYGYRQSVVDNMDY